MSSERKESHQHKALIPFSPIQCQTFFNVIADFLPEGSKIKDTVSSLAGKINNPHLCGKTESFLLSPSSPFLSLAAYGPPDKFSSSPLGRGEAANKAISALKILSKNFEVRLVNNNFINQDRFVKKLPLEMQLMIKQGKDIPELTNFLEKDGTLLFVKRKRIDKDIENLVYDLSLYSGRRLDWLGSWIKNPEGFNLINHFGKRTEKELKKITSEKIAENIIRNRHQKIPFKPGYDGVYGVPIFEEKDMEKYNEESAKIKTRVEQKGLNEFW